MMSVFKWLVACEDGFSDYSRHALVKALSCILMFEFKVLYAFAYASSWVRGFLLVGYLLE